MENLKTELTSAQFKFLTGLEIDMNEIVYGNDIDSYKRTTKAELKQTIGVFKKQPCFDERFEKDPVLLSIEHISKHGLDDKHLAIVLKDKVSISKKSLSGKYSFLIDFLPQNQIEHINSRLRYYHKFLPENQQKPD